MDLIITERPGQIIEEGKVTCTLMSHLFTHLFTSTWIQYNCIEYNNSRVILTTLLKTLSVASTFILF